MEFCEFLNDPNNSKEYDETNAEPAKKPIFSNKKNND